jgi:hypothetical protein
MWSAIASILAGPFINGAVKAYQAKLASGNTSENIAKDLAIRELAVQQKEIEVDGEYKKSLVGHWYEPVNLFGYIMVFHLGKVIVYDNALGLGSTPDLGGNTAYWAGMIMLFFVGKRGFENVAMILRRK